MSAILIVKLLQTAIHRKASAIYLAPGKPPVLRIAGGLQKMETQPLDSSDVAAILENVMPSQSREECQQELQHTGRTEFVYALDEYTRFRTFVHKKSGKVVLGFFSW